MTVTQATGAARALAGGWRWAGPRSACALGLCAPAPAGRRAGRLRFDIAAQPLDAALAAYAQTTGMAVLVASRVTAGARRRCRVGTRRKTR